MVQETDNARVAFHLAGIYPYRMGALPRQTFTSTPIDSGDTIPILQEEATPVSAPIAYREPLGAPIAFPLLVAFVHVTIVSVAAIVAWRYFESTSSSAPFVTSIGEPEPLSGWTASLVEPLRHWDGLWYRLVADRGYGFHEANAAFWPLFPLSMRGLSRVTGLGFDISGFLIANVTFALALILLYRLIGLDFSERISRKSLWVLALFPTSLFFTAVYTESLFLLLSVACLLSARKGKWWLAGLLGALAALTRSYGVFLFLPMLVLLIQQYGFYLRDLVPKLLAVSMPALGPAVFAVFLERELGNWKAFIDVQNMWNRTFAWPWQTMRCAIDGCTLTLTQYGNTSDKAVDGADWSWLQQLRTDFSLDLIASETFRKTVANSDTLELTMTVLFLVLAVVGLFLLPLYQSAWLIPGLIIPLFSPSTVHPLMSMPRFGITLFPLFVVIAIILRWRWLALPMAALSTVLLILLTFQFANWYWVS